MAFFEFGVAVTGLHTAKNAMVTTSNNVANASTKGYSRRVVDINQTIPITSINNAGMVGTGSEVTNVHQMRDFYLDKKYWEQEGKNGEYSTKKTQLDVIETIMNELAEVGMTNDLNNLFNSMSDASVYVNDISYRENVVTNAETFAIDINTLAQSLYSHQIQINDEVEALVSKINSLGKQISSLTQEIYSYEMTSRKEACNLRDERNNLIDEISKLVNVDVKEIPGDTGVEYDKKFYLLINGQEYVNHFYFHPLECNVRDEKINSEDYPYLYDIFFSNNDCLNVDGLSGELGALLQIRDGNTEETDKVISVDFIDTPIMNVTKTGNNAIVNGGTSNFGVFRYNLTLENATSIDIKGYAEGDSPDGVSAYDNNGNVIYQAGQSGKIQEKTLGSVTLNPAYQNADGTYNVTLEVDIDNKTAKLTYKYTDADGNTNTAEEDVDVSSIRSIAYITVNGGGGDLNVAHADVKQKAYAEVYTGYNGIPYYIKKLNTLASTFARAINLGEYADGTKIEGITGHVDAYDKDGETGNLFFSYRDDADEVQTGDLDYSKITAFNLCISKELHESAKNLACSTTSTVPDTADESNSIALLGYLSIKDNETLFKEGDVYNYVNAVSTRLGIDNRQSYKYSEYYESISTTIDNQRLSVSSVSLNEEMSNLLQYQQVYLASSKMINTINSIYNTLINNTF